MEKIMSGLNDLVPRDELHWDSQTDTYSILSKEQTSDVIRACVRVGMEDERDIIKVIEEYERVRSGQMLFKRFLEGSIGIYEFEKDGSPVFEPVRSPR